MDKILQFIEELSLERLNVSSRGDNLYEENSTANSIKRHNLELYLRQMQSLAPHVLLVGEAPGKFGSYRTGIPFTSEDVISTNPFFRAQNYHIIHTPPCVEHASSKLWSVLNLSNNKPVIWNIYPFLPFQADGLYRKPKACETELGLQFVKKLLEIFPIDTIIALGSISKLKIQELEKSGYPNMSFHYINHPSYDYNNQFTTQLTKILNSEASL